MSRQVKRWIAMGVFASILATVFVMLGQWQLRRLDERRENNAVVEAHRDLPVTPYQDVMTGPIDDADQWYRVSATGTYADEQFQVRYRSLDGAYGSEAVAVLETTEGDLLLVNRGFLVRQPGFPDGVLPAPPAGEVTVTGFVRRNDRGDEGAMTPHEGQIRLISSDVLGASLGEELVDGYVQLIESTPPETDVLRTLAAPALDEGPHLSYALQWFAFTLIGVVGMVVLVRADLRDRRRERDGSLPAVASQPFETPPPPAAAPQGTEPTPPPPAAAPQGTEPTPPPPAAAPQGTVAAQRPEGVPTPVPEEPDAAERREGVPTPVPEEPDAAERREGVSKGREPQPDRPSPPRR